MAGEGAHADAVCAGVAEALYLAGVDPHAPARGLLDPRVGAPRARRAPGLRPPPGRPTRPRRARHRPRAGRPGTVPLLQRLLAPRRSRGQSPPHVAVPPTVSSRIRTCGWPT